MTRRLARFLPRRHRSSNPPRRLTALVLALVLLPLLRHGSRNLVRGRDYTVSGNRLTLTAAAPTELAGDRAYGVHATLEAGFSRGVPWRIDVITYDRPVPSNASGGTGGLSVPTRFQGDLLATMEARYDDGSDAGPASRTPYQQWDSAARVRRRDSDWTRHMTAWSRVPAGR